MKWHEVAKSKSTTFACSLHNWPYFSSVAELTVAEDKHQEDFQNIPVDGQTDQNNRFCFSVLLLCSDISDTNSCRS